MEIKEWIKCVCYFEYNSSFHNQLIHIYPTIDFTQNELKSIFSLSFPRTINEPKAQFYSFILRRENHVLHGYTFYDPSITSFPPLTGDKWSSSSSVSSSDNENENEKNKKENKNKNKKKKKKKKKKTNQENSQNSEEYEIKKENENEKEKEIGKNKEKNKKEKEKEKEKENQNEKEKQTLTLKRTKFDPNTDPDPDFLCGTELLLKGGRSVVILSEHPWESLFTCLLEELGPDIMDDPGRLEAWFDFIVENWPTELKRNYCYAEFPLTPEQRLRVFIPGEPQSIFEHSGEVSCYERYFGLDLDICELLWPAFDDLWNLWQLLITGESIVVFAPQPEICSQVVRALCSLIYPFEYQGYVIPYCTKYDQNWNFIRSIDFTPKEKLTTEEVESRKSIIVGTTDYSLGVSTFYHWPNHLFIGLPDRDIEKKKKKKDRVKQGLFMDKQSIVLVHKQMLKWLTQVQKNVSYAQESSQKTTAIRDYFFSFTNDFMNPFEVYFNTLIPDMGSLEPFYTRMVLKGFDENEFIQRLTNGKSSLPFQKHEVTDCEFLYRKFIHTQTFKVWYQNKRNLCAHVFWKYWRKAVLHLEAYELFKQGGDPEKINLFMRLGKRVDVAKQYDDWELFDKYVQLMEQILIDLPKELRSNLDKVVVQKKLDKIEKIELSEKLKNSQK
ncbi:hypothetical protein M0813_00806 [Anaeramoeba flamelloides]|uniref:UDENN domain-containing protein n=1 Tax=Anaeramoeba flamelloides TaxID=1746091 RepID=A0ABQ8XEB8_9EUKA|nr:hypothetical protein M0813_00806 [Anaeramoeba flamelloides]